MDENTQNQGKTGTAATADALVQDASRLKENVVQLGADAKAHGQAHLDRAKQSVVDAKQRLNDAIARAQEEVVAHPFGILAVGVALGFLFGRRSRKRRSE